MPTTYKITESTLDLDEPASSFDITHSHPNNSVDNFRDYANDFIVLVINSLERHPQALNNILESIQSSAIGDPPHLELAVYLVTCIAEFRPQFVSLCKTPIITILTRENELNEFLCSRVVGLVGKLHSLFETQPELLPMGLSFLLKALNFEQLAPLAS